MSLQPSDQLARTTADQAKLSFPKAAAAEARFFAEDGWVFREFPGKPVECVGRCADVAAAD